MPRWHSSVSSNGQSMSDSANSHQLKLMRILGNITAKANPPGWNQFMAFSVGGLHSVGFSRNGPYLLVVSSQGRGLFDCENGHKITRDQEPYKGLSDNELVCDGIGPIAGEAIALTGLAGGGMPHGTQRGEFLHLVAPNWPEQDLILSQDYGDPYNPRDQSKCVVIYTNHVRAYGFSWCGNFIVAACGSDFSLWQRIERVSS